MRQQSSEWIAEERVKVYGIIIAVIEIAGLLISMIRSIYFPDANSDFNPGGDFRVFWSGAHLALGGDPTGVYDPNKIFAVLQSIDPALTEQRAWHSWFYPPAYLLVMLPFGLMPWRLAYILFIFTTFAAYLVLIRKIAIPYRVWWFVLGFPPVLFTFTLGQNSFLTAFLAGMALMQLDRRPVLAGVCIGLLSMKPHLAILFPVALIVGRRKDALWAAGVTVITLISVSTSVFGLDTSILSVKGIVAARAAVLEPYWLHVFMPTVYAGALGIGAGESLANALQLGCAAVAVCVVGWIWRHEVSANVRNSALILATLLTSPHLFTYDLTWLALPIIWITIEGRKTGWLKGERSMLAFAWVSPLVLIVVAAMINANPTWVVSMSLLGYVVLRARRELQIASLKRKTTLAA